MSPEADLRLAELVAVRPAGGVLATEVDGELVLLEPDSGRYFGLNALGVAVWEELAAADQPAAVVERLLARFEVDRATLEADVAQLIAELERAGLLHVVRG